MPGELASIVDRLLRIVEPAYASAGYLLVAVTVLAERSILVGLVIPGDVILALGGVYAAEGKLSVWGVIGIGAAAALCGESIGYWLGRRYGRALFARIPGLRRLEGRLETAEDYFRRHGGKTVAIGRYATAIGAFVPLTAGIARMPFGRFLAFDVPAVLVWATGITLFGYLFGENLDVVDRALSRFGAVVLAVVVVLVLWRVGVVLARRRRASRPNGPGA